MSAAAAMRAEGSWRPRDIDLGEERSLFLAERGEGAPVVLIHGAMVDHRDWILAAEAAGLPGRLVSVDRPGHGESRRRRYEASPQVQARQLRRGLEQLGVERPLIVGHSFGGAVALAYAAAEPESVSGLLLLAPIVFPEFRAIEQLYFGPRATPLAGAAMAETARASSDNLAWPLLRKAMFAPQEPPPAFVEAYPTEVVMDPGKTVSEGEDVSSLIPGLAEAAFRYPAIRCPVVVLQGDKDLVVDRRRHAEHLPWLVRQAQVRTLAGVGHMLHHADPGVVATAMRELAPVR